MSKKILHLIPFWRITNTTLKFFDNLQTNFDNTYCIYLHPFDNFQITEELKNIKPIVFYQSKERITNTRNWLKLAAKYDKIIIHSLGMIDRFSMICFLSFKRDILKKIIWIEFGQDFYNIHLKRRRLLTRKIIDYFFLKKIPTIIAIFEGDIPYIAKTLPNATIHFIPYSFTNLPQFSNSLELNQREKKNILISHRYRKFINYKRILNRLSKYHNFSDEFNIIIPLAGAPNSTIKNISSYANKIFKNVIIHNELIPTEKYNEFLSTIDIAIIDCEILQQVALGTINRLLQYGKKVYLPNKCSMYKFYKSKGIEMFSLEDIGKTNYYEFIKNPTINDRIKDLMNDLYDIDKNQERWNNLFSQILID